MKTAKYLVGRFIELVRHLLKKMLFPAPIVAAQQAAQQDSRLLGLMRNLSLSRAGFPALFPNPFAARQTLIAPVRFLDLLDGLEGLLTAAELDYIRKHEARLVLDMSVEAAEYTGYSEQKLLSLHRALAASGIDPSRVFLINANVVSERTLPAWAARRGLGAPLQARGYSFYLYEYLAELLVSDWFKGIYPRYVAERTRTAPDPDRRLFICLNLRPRPHRLAIVLHLLRSGLFDRSVVSFFGEEFGHSDTKSVATQEEALEFVRALPSGRDLLGAFPKLQSMLPVTVDRDASLMRKDLWQRKPGEIAFLFPESAADGTPICTTHFEIVTETWFTDDSCLYVTEKTLRPIIRMQPFIMVGCPGTLAYLWSLGFQTFSPFIDESYDGIVDPTRRFEAICREIDRLAGLSPTDLRDLQTALWPRLQHNSRWLLTQGATIAECEIEQNLRF